MKKKIILSTIFWGLFISAQNLWAQSEVQEDTQINWAIENNVDIFRPMSMKINKDDFLKILDMQPSFAIYKDNYFITGIPIDKEINKYTANAKFQISFRQRLTKTILPYNTFLMLTYSQKSFWNIYAKSSPFKDNNYNPGLALIKPIIHNDMFRGMASIALEHESNGKDGLDSRGWNYVILSGVYYIDIRFSVQVKLWGGILDPGTPELVGDGNPDLYDYRGFGLINLNYRSLNNKLWISGMINPRKKFGDFNTQLELNFKLSQNSNQYLYMQWYQGYGESMLDYKQYSSMVRIGICIKSPMGNLY